MRRRAIATGCSCGRRIKAAPREFLRVVRSSDYLDSFMPSFPYLLSIPSQGVSQRFNDLEELKGFFSRESQFFSSLALLDETLVVANQNYGAVGREIINQARTFFKAVANGSNDAILDRIDEYAKSAGDMRILVGQGHFGSRIAALCDSSRSEALWSIALTCFDWITEPSRKIALSPFRAFANVSPTREAQADLLSTAEALANAAAAAKTISEAQVELTAYLKAKTDVFDELESIYRVKLTMEEPASSWEKIASDKARVWKGWLVLFAIAVLTPLLLAWFHWEALMGTLTKLTSTGNGGFSIAGLAAVSVPALFYAWLLKNISRVFIQNLNLADDAYHRRSLALTYMGLLQDKAHPATDAERAIILNALFRPIPPQTSDEGPPSGIIELIKK